MTTRQLGFQAPPTLAVTAGAVSPNPGIAGVQVWSSTANALMAWDGNSWELVGGGAAPTEDSVFDPVDFNDPDGWAWHASGDGFGISGSCVSYTTGSTSGVGPTGADVSPLGRYHHTQAESGTTSFTAAGVWNQFGMVTREHGFVFECMMGFVPATGGQMFMGMQGGGALFANGPDNANRYIGIGGFGSDDLNTMFRIYFGDGTTANTSVVVNRPAGTRNNPLYKVYIRVPSGSTTAKLWVIDYGIAGSPGGITVLDGYSLDISSLPLTALIEGSMGYGTGAGTTNKVTRLFWMKLRQWLTPAVFPEAAANITGNAATADTLFTPRNIQGVPFNGSANIDVVSIGATAPSNPTLNQLWIQTA